MSKHLLCLVLVLLILSGCSDNGSEAMLDNYTYRLSNALDTERPPVGMQLLPALPPRRERILATSDIREGLLDVLQLGECNLLSLIAERNSSLGKVYTPSSKLIYEIRFLRNVNQCHDRLLQQDQADQALIGKLAEIRRNKQDNLAAELWNGIFTAPEIEQHYARQASAITADSKLASDTVAALNTLLHLTDTALNNKLPDDSQLQQVEQAYATLHHSEIGAQLTQGMNRLTAYLNQATDLINRRLEQRPMCLKPQATPQARILRNVFQKFYAGEVQVYLALIQKQAGDWLAVNRQLQALFEQAGVLPPSMKQYFQLLLAQDMDSLWQRYLNARDGHTRAWQKILRQCGMMPSA